MAHTKKIKLIEQLPEGWEPSTLSDISSYIQRGKSPKYTDFSNLPIVNQKCIRWHGIDREFVKYIHPDQIPAWEAKRFLKTGDLLWNSTGTGTIGRAALVNLLEGERLVADSHVTIVRPDEKFEPKFVHYWIMSPAVQNSIEAMQSGSTNQVELIKGEVENTPMPVAPLNEQKRIVAKLEELFSDLDAATAALERVRANLKRYRASVLKSAVEGKLTAEWRAKNPPKETGAQLLERILLARRAKWEENQLAKFKAQGKEPPKGWREKYPQPAKPDTSNLPELPEGWVWATVDMVVYAIEAGKSYRCIERPPQPDEVGIVKVSAVSWGEYLEEESKTCYSIKNKTQDLLIKKGDFLISRANTIQLIGACVIAESITKTLMLSDKILRLKFAMDIQHWLLISLRSFFGRNEIRRLSTGNQDSMRNIGQEKLRQVRIAIPPENEIKAIEGMFDEITQISDRTIDEIQAKLKHSKSLRQTILKQAFEGKLVPQDPSDEPASELLKRIREEREKAESKAKAAKVVKEPQKKQPRVGKKSRPLASRKSKPK